MTTYRISTRDPGRMPAHEWRWNVRRSGMSPRQLRSAIREFLALGYSDVSILVEREGA
jgi:hypothetical protein